MQAAVVNAFGKKLSLQEWQIRSPGPGQILVKTDACGICHTDLHAARGDWPVKPSLPFIPGHEGIGLVAAIGAGVEGVREGDRFGVGADVAMQALSAVNKIFDRPGAWGGAVPGGDRLRSGSFISMCKSERIVG
jgi:threonine dehydrogenase-like Zn-dependent dehydrogenase